MKRSEIVCSITGSSGNSLAPTTLKGKGLKNVATGNHTETSQNGTELLGRFGVGLGCLLHFQRAVAAGWVDLATRQQYFA